MRRTARPVCRVAGTAWLVGTSWDRLGFASLQTNTNRTLSYDLP